MNVSRGGVRGHCDAILASMTTVFETDRLIVRHWTEDDAEDAFAIFGDPEVMRYVGDTGEPHPDVRSPASACACGMSDGVRRPVSETGP